jgi:hypothetical protein
MSRAHHDAVNVALIAGDWLLVIGQSTREEVGTVRRFDA